jgi:hypothetical protein
MEDYSSALNNEIEMKPKNHKRTNVRSVMIKEEKEKSESETEYDNEKISETDGDSTLVAEDKQESSNNEDIPTKTVVYDSVKAKLMKKYSDIVSKKNKRSA